MHRRARASGAGRLVFSDTAIQCALTLRVLFQLPLRTAPGLTGSLMRLAEFDWSVPHYSTLWRGQKALTVTILYRPGGEPLHLMVDSTGLKVLGVGTGRSGGTVLIGDASGAKCTWRWMPRAMRSVLSR